MWRAFWGLVRKEFIQVIRDRNMLRLIFLMPIIQLFLFGYVVNTEVRLVDVDMYDFDRSRLSRDFRQTVAAGDYFIPRQSDVPVLELDRRFREEASEIVMVIPEDFTERLQRREVSEVGVIADGSNANRTSIALGYLARMTNEFARDHTSMAVPVDAKYRFLYNPETESVYFMVPGIVAALLTMITVMLTSMGIVREREAGTLEQLLVTPISGTTLLFGKLFPFAVLGMVEITLALGLGVWWFEVPFVGSVLLLFVLSILYLFTTLGMGLLFSTVTGTQQQAMFFAWFFSVFAILTSGFFTPISNMPEWMQYVTYLNPMRYFIDIARGIMMKDASASDLAVHIRALVIFGAAIFTTATLLFSKRTD